MMTRRKTNSLAIAVIAALSAQALPGAAQVHQTETLSALSATRDLPYRVSVQEYDFGVADLPTLHSFAAAEYDGKWVLLAGRTNGLHGFEQAGANNFPEEFQNRDVWVIDPVGKQTWRRSLQDVASGLTADAVAALTPTNNQFTQLGEQLYMTGGYGVNAAGAPGTFDVLSALDLPGIVDWVQNGTGQASDHVRQISDPTVSVTGGAMVEMNGKLHLVFGQDFQGGYNPTKNGTYTKEVRSFEIVDDGVSLAIQNATSQAGATPEESDAFRRRDLNIFPVVRPDGIGGTEEGVVVLSGVFTTGFGAWTVPVEVDAAGVPRQVDNGNHPLNLNDELDNDPSVFRQGFNGYHSAKFGMFSESTGAMHELLFGGISLQTYDQNSGQIVIDDLLPFVNDITSVAIDATGHYRQYHLGEFPEITDQQGKRLRFGSNAEFFAAEGIEKYGNGVIDFDALARQTSLGFIYGGITANGPHTRGFDDVSSAASNRIFEVVLHKVPEPNSGALSCGLAQAVAMLFSRRKRRIQS